MQAIITTAPGDESVLQLADVAAPALTPDSVRLRVRATAVNRADLLQRQGRYPPPPGASPILGLECVGTILEVGRAVTDYTVGERVMALLTGGGYATEVVAPAATLMRVPKAFSDAEAAAFPETFLTAYANIFLLGRAVAPARVLIHGGSSGVGTAAVQLCKRAGFTPYVTAGSAAKCARLADMGAVAIDYRNEDFVARIREHTQDRGVDVVLDSIGASYFERNVQCLATGGRLVLIGLMGGSKSEVNLATLLTRHLEVIGSSLRSRTDAAKADIIARLFAQFGDAIDAGALRPIIHTELPLTRAADAHRLMQSSAHFGKIVLHVAG